MRITGLISAQRPGPPRGWTEAGVRSVHVIVQAGVNAALALPPQTRGDAAHLTLMMAQVYGATQAPSSASAAGYGTQPPARASLFRVDA